MSSNRSNRSSAHSTDVYKHLDDHGLRLAENDYVDWRPDDKQHPRNWCTGKKTYNVFLLCFFEFWMTAISSSGVRFTNVAFPAIVS